MANKDPIHIQLKSAVFCSVFDPSQGDGGVFELADTELSVEGVSKEFADLEKRCSIQAKKCEIKLVGRSSAIETMNEILAALGLTVKSSSVRDAPDTEIIFHPQTGRLQVAISASTASSKIKVLIVDDSATIRKLLVSILSRDPEIEVVATAELPSQVEALLEKHHPDVVTLDIHMPEMDGVTLLKKFAPKFHIPVVIITSLSMEEGPLVLDALEHGAVDYIQKPSFEVLDQMAPLIIEKVKIASKANVRKKPSSIARASRLNTASLDVRTVIAIGSSTGGTEALKEVLVRLPEKIPPIVIVQHIPAVFSLAFANRMNSLCPFEVKEAQDGDEVLPNRVLIAPGGLQMSVKAVGTQLKVVVQDAPPVNRHKPSVDVLFDSVAEHLGKHAIGAILTGMGGDGARGLLKMREKGARTIAQDEATCIVFGMPREAIRLHAAQEIKPLLEIPELLLRWSSHVKAA